VAAGALAVGAAVLTMRAAAPETPMTSVVVAAEPLSVGVRLDNPETVLRVAAMPAGAELTGLATALDQVRGRTVAVPISAGEPLTEAALGGAPGLAPAPLAAGERGLSVPTSSAGAAAAVLVPGSRVDVVASNVDEPAGARVVVANAEVIAQAPPGTDSGAGDDGGSILLRVGQRDALRLTAALDRAGGVRLLPRPAGEAP